MRGLLARRLLPSASPVPGFTNREGTDAAPRPLYLHSHRGEAARSSGRPANAPEDTAVPVVTLRSLSPRELIQNTGLAQREAELARQRDFDDVFFFAGVSEEEVAKFLAEGRNRRLQFRQHGVLWSAAIGASVQRCIRELAKLYDRALRYHAHTVGIATPDSAAELFPFCERTILLSDRKHPGVLRNGPDTSRTVQLPLHSPDVWERLLESLA